MGADALPAVDILRAETVYLPPTPRRGQPAQDWSQVPGAELVYKWVEVKFGWRIPAPTQSVPNDPGLYARIDDGRWIAECTACASAWMVSPVDPRFGCPMCRRDWVPLVLPDDIAAAEAEALALTRRFWFHPDDPVNPTRDAAPEPEPEPETPAEPEEPQP